MSLSWPGTDTRPLDLIPPWDMFDGLREWGLLPLTPSPRPPAAGWSPDLTWLGILPTYFPRDAQDTLDSLDASERHSLLLKISVTITDAQKASWESTRALLSQAYTFHKRIATGTTRAGPSPTYFMRVWGQGHSSATELTRLLASYAPKRPPDRASFGSDCRRLGIPPGDRALAWALFRAGFGTAPAWRNVGWSPPSPT
jgi:hypothetical protein